jgi:hypothetical protein
MSIDFIERAQQFADDFSLKRAVLGIEAQRFLATPLGRRLLEVAEQDIEDGYKRLAVVNPTDTAAILKAQFDIAVARYIPQALNAIINEGVAAENTIEREEAAEQEY